MQRARASARSVWSFSEAHAVEGLVFCTPLSLWGLWGGSAPAAGGGGGCFWGQQGYKGVLAPPAEPKHPPSSVQTRIPPILDVSLGRSPKAPSSVGAVGLLQVPDFT